MRTRIGTAAILLALACSMLWRTEILAAAAPSDTTSKTKADSTKVNTATDTTRTKTAPDTTKAHERIAPVAKSYVTSTSSDISFGNRVDITTDAGKGWTLMNSVSVDRRQYRQNKIQDLSETFMNQAAKGRPGLYAAVFSIGENYHKTKTLGLGRFGQDIIFDNEDANLALNYIKPVLKASTSKLAVAGDVRRGLNDFKYDRDFAGSGTSSLNYALSLFGSPLTVGGGVGGSLKRETSDIGRRRFGPLRSNADTLNASMTYGPDAKALNATYSVYNVLDRKVMPPLGNTYEVLNDPSKAQQEEARSRVAELDVNSTTQPFSFLGLDLKYKHSVSDSKYKVDTRLSSSSKDNSLGATANYLYASSGSVRFSVTTSEDISDYGPVSLSSYRERKHLVGVGLNQTIGDSVSVTANGSGSLRQDFYLNRVQNPRDADYLYYHGDVSFRAPFRKITTNVTMLSERYSTINIDGTFSGDNRIDYKYQVEPVITVRPAPWIAITQDYMVKIEYTEFVFTADKNYLNRTTSVSTEANFAPMGALSFLFRHSYLMRDTGSYLQGDVGKVYSPTNGTREHSLDLTLGYQLAPGFSVTMSDGFKIQDNDVFGGLNGRVITLYTTTFKSGGMRAGFTKTKKYGDYGEIALDVAYVRNYGPFITPQLREYVEANSAVTLRF